LITTDGGLGPIDTDPNIFRVDTISYDLLKQCPSKGDKYVIDEELQHTDHLFLGVACFTFLNFV
jgi:hypothetical protein